MGETSLEYNIRNYPTWEEFLKCLNDSTQDLLTPETEELLSIQIEIKKYLDYILSVSISETEFKNVKHICLSILENIVRLAEEPKELQSVISVEFKSLSLRTILEKLKCLCPESKSKVPPLPLLDIEESLERKSLELLESSEYDSASSQSSKSDDVQCPEQVDFRNENVNMHEFLGLRHYANYFVDDLLRKASYMLKDLNIDLETKPHVHQDVLSIEKFSPKVGLEFIKMFVNQWEKEDNWKYCIALISINSNPCFESYVYEVTWSIPTNSYPIPQATASVFFIIEVSRVIPPACPVKITYSFESQHSIYTLTDPVQHMKLISNILITKLKFFSTIKF